MFLQTSIRDNIAYTYSSIGAKDEQIEAAARIANAHDFITALPQGYRHYLRRTEGNAFGWITATNYDRACGATESSDYHCSEITSTSEIESALLISLVSNYEVKEL